MNSLELEQAKYLQGIANELEDAKHGEKGKIIQRACQHLTWSKDKLYSRLNNLGFSSGRTTRTDKGNTSVSKAHASAIASLIRASSRDNNKILMTVGQAIDIAFANDLIPEQFSESSVKRALKRYGLEPRKMQGMTTTTSMRSLHPNHTYQFDVSICVLYYLSGKKGLRAMPESEFYKNKPNNLERIRNERVLRYLVTDHFSGAFFLRYYIAPGENTETITQFLFDAFCERDGQELVYGVPKNLVWDAGSANISHQTKHLLEILQVNHLVHTPGKPWAKGQVESTHNIVERHFESRLAFMTVDSVEELNRAAQAWSIGFQSTKKHTRHKQTRYAKWQTIRAEQLRLIPDVNLVRSMMQQTKPETRKVSHNDLSISFAPKGYGSHRYSLEHIKHISSGDEVKVYINPYSAPDLRVISTDDHGEEHIHEVKAMEMDDAGFPLNAPVYGESYASTRKTVVDRNRSSLDKEAWGTDDSKEIKRRRKGKAVAFDGEIDSMADVHKSTPPIHMRRPGTELKIEKNTIEEPIMSFVGLLGKVKARLNPDKEAFKTIKKVLKLRHPEGATESEMHIFIQQWEQGHDSNVKASSQ
ncbi:transposase [Vibrio europaeus]|uniref:transposase n=1 Tax=Vibrio europaeus TaxID=300876 RepID=UPI00233E8830|nr:transposase [Vibrio europaeus]MDC5755212.1 transposase [Vibrio europaeus]MDC5775791.1 transposase [Vibrio europaeus]MDC5794929.1 transposase [Vibrio europaeus]MDC5799500.1 transposase [Vibrio europaeus]MDC5817208.1 transposase [Vibrio europaeus]